MNKMDLALDVWFQCCDLPGSKPTLGPYLNSETLNRLFLEKKKALLEPQFWFKCLFI